MEVNDDMNLLMKNRTWELVILPKNQRLIEYKWIFEKKEGIPGIKEPRFKARLVQRFLLRWMRLITMKNFHVC